MTSYRKLIRKPAGRAVTETGAFTRAGYENDQVLALGIAIDMPARNRPALRAVLLQDPQPADTPPSLADVTLVESFEVPTADEDRAKQLKDLAETVSARIRTLKPDIVVIRRADVPPRSSNKEGPRIRLMATGAVAAAARILVARTVIRDGKECGTAYGANKEKVDADASTLVNERLREAAAAALAGLVADRG